MTSPEEIRELGRQRLKEAGILSENSLFDGAYYLAGYSLELFLKAKIAERLGFPNIYDDTYINREDKGIGEIKKLIKTHNLVLLLIVCGLKEKYELEIKNNKSFIIVNSLLLNSWDESCRYKPCGHFAKNDVIKIINVLKEENGILRWIEKN